MHIDIIGIDCATEPRKVGLAKGFLRDGKCVVTSVQLGNKSESISSAVKDLINVNTPTLIDSSAKRDKFNAAMMN